MPDTEDEAIANGSHDRWLSVVNDARYVLQEMKRDPEGTLSLISPAATKSPKAKLKRDWAENMGTGTHGTAGVYSAKYAFTTNGAACSDFVVFPTSGTGSSSVPNIIAYNDLYDTTCNSGSPTQFWAASFEVGTTYGTVTTSPVLSIDGSEVAFMATISSHAYLVVLLMPTGDVSTVTSFTCPSTTNVNNTTTATGALYAWCAELGDAHTDTRSSPFYDINFQNLFRLQRFFMASMRRPRLVGLSQG
jgi:hypothetical protein